MTAANFSIEVAPARSWESPERRTPAPLPRAQTPRKGPPGKAQRPSGPERRYSPDEDEEDAAALHWKAAEYYSLLKDPINKIRYF